MQIDEMDGMKKKKKWKKEGFKLANMREIE